MDIARVEAGRLELRPERVSVAAIDAILPRIGPGARPGCDERARCGGRSRADARRDARLAGARKAGAGFSGRMPSLDAACWDDGERLRIEAALQADLELAEELELIVGLLEPGARARFWRALAGELRVRDRPAAAVLAALERAAISDRD